MTRVPRLCTTDDCNREGYVKGLCRPHYQKQWKSSRPCEVEECERPYVARGYCGMHYARLNKTGTIDPPKTKTPEERRAATSKYNREYYEKNKERNQERNRKRSNQWRLDNPEKYLARKHRRRARELEAATDNHTLLDVLEMYGTDCHICLEPINLDAPRGPGTGPGWERGLQEDHVIPLSKGGSHTLDNCRPSHGLCNLKKGAKL